MHSPWLLLLLLLAAIGAFDVTATAASDAAGNNRTFIVDWENDRFLMDGKPFRFISGSFHYFRAHPDSWQRKLRTMRAAGLNAVATYVEWSLHNPKDGTYVWDGIADLVRFIELAAAEDLLVILRPGPYICAERDFGGFPYWLLTKYPNIQLRTADINYLHEVRLWYSQLMPRIAPLLYGNGGPIIMVQVENEYGSYYACDKKYTTWLRDETLAHTQNKAALFTNDGSTYIYCGHIEGVLQTLDFGPEDNQAAVWSRLRKLQPKGPLVNAEYYSGWLTHWTEPIARKPTDIVKESLDKLLADGANVNFYMFMGGTNFGFTAGANSGGPGQYQPDITSYDYDALMDEAGDATPKYHVIREVIGRYLPLPNMSVPEPTPKRHYGTLRLLTGASLLSDKGRQLLATGTVRAQKPQTFEQLGQYSGLVLYETDLPSLQRDPSVLRLNGLHDRAYIYVDGHYVGLLSRETPIYSLPIPASAAASSGSKLQILVENQGRLNYGVMTDFKGLVSDVYLDNVKLMQWNMTKYPLESYEDIERLIQQAEPTTLAGFRAHNERHNLLSAGPTVFYGVLNIAPNQVRGHEQEVYDTYLDASGWGKGVLYVNGENLGRYWPLAGPQITLYVPREVLRVGANKIVLIEYQKVAETQEVTFTDKPNLSGLKNHTK